MNKFVLLFLIILCSCKTVPKVKPRPITKDHFFIFGGGYSATGNQISLEKNIFYMNSLLKEHPPASKYVLFADGDRGERSLVGEYDLFAVQDCTWKTSVVLLMAPQGEVFKQKTACELKDESHLIFICGHYEGIDDRVRQALVDREISIGDYVLSNGNLAAMIIADAVIRLIPGALGSEMSAETESFSDGLLEYPQFTRPEVFRGMDVPEVLLSGNHEKIEQWRKEKSLEITRNKRPDLFEGELK